MSHQFLQGDCLQVLPTLEAQSVQMCVTSPPYFGLRNYSGGDAEIGREATPAEFVAAMVAVFREVHRVLRDDGALWLNLGDSYNSSSNYSPNAPSNTESKQSTNAGSNTSRRLPILKNLKPKDLIGIPWRVAFALQDDGWYLRQDIIWAKPNPMPESVTDRCTKSHEYLFLLTKSAKYFYDADAIREEAKPESAKRYAAGYKSYANGQYEGSPTDKRKARDKAPEEYAHLTERNKRSVWTVATQPCSEAHFATFPPKLIEPCILAGSRPSDTVLDPFSGAGTTAMVACEHGRNAIGIELNPDYIAIAERRIQKRLGMFAAST